SDERPNSLRLNCATFDTSLRSINPSEFPRYFNVSGGPSIRLAVGDMITGINQVLFAISRDESRPPLSGVLMAFSKKTLALVGGDGYRIAERKLELSVVASAKDAWNVIVPGRALDEKIGR